MYVLPNIDISTKSSENALPTKKCTKHAAYHKKVPQKNFPCMGKKSGQRLLTSIFDRSLVTVILPLFAFFGF
jgi:hypothetical protein